jgi:hypothetical protein
MKIELFHSIGDAGAADSAEVRRFITENGLKDRIDFRNVSYEEAARDLIERTGARETPVLIVDGEPVRGRAQIIDWLKTNLHKLRD